MAPRDQGEAVPHLPEAHDVVAILCSDLHLSHKPPIARSCEADWYETMASYLHQLKVLSDQQIPIICAGDIFDKWNSPAELINFALMTMPNMYAIPGQHDLPNHNYADIERSAFFSLVMAGKVYLLGPNSHVPVGSVVLHGYPFGFEVAPCKKSDDLALYVAVVHQYVWTKQTGYPGASTKGRLKSFAQQVKGYDAVVIGDNHKGFLSETLNILNCGGFMRRKIDEINYKPSVGLLHVDGKITRHYLDTSHDKFLTGDDLAKAMLELGNVNMDEFLVQMRNLSDSAISFRDAVNRAVLDTPAISEATKQIILSAMEE